SGGGQRERAEDDHGGNQRDGRAARDQTDELGAGLGGVVVGTTLVQERDAAGEGLLAEQAEHGRQQRHGDEHGHEHGERSGVAHDGQERDADDAQRHEGDDDRETGEDDRGTGGAHGTAGGLGTIRGDGELVP